MYLLPATRLNILKEENILNAKEKYKKKHGTSNATKKFYDVYNIYIISF